ncbi:dockerin type I domain-containing protein, partial [Planctomycetota bacterium]
QYDFWVSGDYHLLSFGWWWNENIERWRWDYVTSPCIDAGNPATPLGDELLTIPTDPTNRWGVNLRINMGAYGGTAEAGMPPHDWALRADLTNDGIVNLEDFAHQANDWLKTESEQPGDLNRDGTLDILDLALLMQEWLIQTTWRKF